MVFELKPALAPISAELSGGIHFPDDVSGDAQRFGRALAKHWAATGTRVRYEARVEQVLTSGGAVSGPMVNEAWSTDGVVLAATSYTPALAGATPSASYRRALSRCSVSARAPFEGRRHSRVCRF